jgi:hypothetical protein
MNTSSRPVIEGDTARSAPGTAPLRTGKISAVARRRLFPLIAMGLVLLFSGGTCILVVCSEQCDPCAVSTCKCSTCSHHPNGFDASHRLDVFGTSVWIDRENHVTRIYSDILGLSLDRALGAGAHSENDMVRFALDVLAVNGERFRSNAGGGRWVLDDVQRFDGSSVVVLHETSASSRRTENPTASFLFDVRGNLLEIDHALR